jgi:hypothetical protein
MPWASTAANYYIPHTPGIYIYNRPKGGCDKWWAMIYKRVGGERRSKAAVFYTLEEARTWVDMMLEKYGE